MGVSIHGNLNLALVKPATMPRYQGKTAISSQNPAWVMPRRVSSQPIFRAILADVVVTGKLILLVASKGRGRSRVSVGVQFRSHERWRQESRQAKCCVAGHTLHV